MSERKKDDIQPLFSTLIGEMGGFPSSRVRIKDYSTGEEWIINTSSGRPEIESHKEPGLRHRSRLKKVPMSARIFEAVRRWGSEDLTKKKEPEIVQPRELPSNIVVVMTKDIEGKGLHKVKDHETGEEWIIENTDGKILIHSNKAPGRLHRSRALKTRVEPRIMKALTEWGKEKLSKEESEKRFEFSFWWNEP